MAKLGRVEPRGAPAAKPVETHGPLIGVSGITAGRDVTVHITHIGGERMVEQGMTGVKSGGTVEQRSATPVRQTMDTIDAAGDVRQIIESAGPGALAAELTKVLGALKAYDPAATAVADKLTAAATAAQAGDAAGAAGHLRGIGKWVGELATKVGASLVAHVIEKQAGF